MVRINQLKWLDITEQVLLVYNVMTMIRRIRYLHFCRFRDSGDRREK